MESQVVHIGPVATPDRQCITKPLRRHERGFDATTLGDCVDDYSRAVDKECDRLRWHVAGFDGFEHALREVGGRCRGFYLEDLSGRRVEHDDVGKGSADIDGDAKSRTPHAEPSQPWMELAVLSSITPFSRSRRTAARSRCSGSPQSPPFPVTMRTTSPFPSGRLVTRPPRNRVPFARITSK